MVVFLDTDEACDDETMSYRHLFTPKCAEWKCNIQRSRSDHASKMLAAVKNGQLPAFCEDAIRNTSGVSQPIT